MAILARLAFHPGHPFDQVDFEGIEDIQPDDLAYAKELGSRSKLLGVAEKLEDGITVRGLSLFPLSRTSVGADRGTVQRGDGRGARRSPR